jgi:hypothetical protein
MATMLHQSQCSSGCFDALRDDLHAERLGQPDNGADYSQVAGVGAQVTYE